MDISRHRLQLLAPNAPLLPETLDHTEDMYSCLEADGDGGDSMVGSRYFSPSTNPRIMTKRKAMSVGTVTGKKKGWRIVR